MTEVYLGPAQAGLRDVENEELEMFDVACGSALPIPIVIFEP